MADSAGKLVIEEEASKAKSKRDWRAILKWGGIAVIVGYLVTTIAVHIPDIIDLVKHGKDIAGTFGGGWIALFALGMLFPFLKGLINKYLNRGAKQKDQLKNLKELKKKLEAEGKTAEEILEELKEAKERGELDKPSDKSGENAGEDGGEGEGESGEGGGGGGGGDGGAGGRGL